MDVQNPTVSDEAVFDSDTLVFYGGPALKALGEGRIGGYLVPFGFPKDTDGEYFTPDTDFALDWYDGKLPVLFHHGLSDAKGEKIGEIVTIEPRDGGLYAEAQLYMDKPLAVRLYEDAQGGKVGWSSGSVPHQVEVDTDGRIKRWPLVEGTLTYSPAGGQRTTINAIKSANSQAIQPEPEPEPKEPRAKEGNEPQTEKATPIVRIQWRNKSMDFGALIAAMQGAGVDSDSILKVLAEVGMGGGEAEGMMADGESEVMEDEYKAEEPVKTEDAAKEKKPVKADGKIDAQQLAAILDGFAKAQKSAEHARKTAPATEDLPGVQRDNPATKTQPRVQVFSKFKDLSAEDMAYLLTIRKARAVKEGNIFNPGDAYYREMTEKAQNGLKSGSIKLEQDQANRILALKSNELNSTAAADDGGDWVPTLWSSDLWERTRIDNMVVSSLRTVEMPSASYELPIESTDPSVYAVAETQDQNELNIADSTNHTFTLSKVTADKVTLTSKKLGLQTAFSAEIEEDSIIQFIPQLRAQAMRSFQNAIDNVTLNADATTGTSNINYADGNTSAVPKAKFLYGGGDGIRHLPLVDATGQAIDLGGAAPTLTKIRKARFSLLGAYAVRPSELAYFVDVQTYGKLLSIDELLVFMNNGRDSTVNSGLVPTIDGSPVYPSEELSLSNSSGFVSATTSNNELGTLLVVHRPSWTVGYRRRITSDVTYRPYDDAYVLTMTVRMALARRDAQCAAMLYNIGVS